MQPLLPLLPHHQAVAQIPIQEHLVAVLDQPPMHLTGQRRILTGMADEHPGHNTLATTPPLPHPRCPPPPAVCPTPRPPLPLAPPPPPPAHHRRGHPPWRLEVYASTPTASSPCVLKKVRRGCCIHPNPWNSEVQARGRRD